ncbi:MAG: MarR family winged helix-turn-helix transcriptional regulator [Pseudomonadota bacterium]
MKRAPNRLHALLHSASIIEKRVEALLKETGTRHRQALILDILEEFGPTAQKHLAARFGVAPGSMSSMITRLVALEYVSQSTNPEDRRRDIVALTDKGRAALKDVYDAWDNGDHLLEEALGSTRADELFRLTDDLCKSLGAHRPELKPSD